MNTNCIGLMFSMIYIGLILILAYLLKKKTKVKDEFVRKTIHILTANWWIILVNYFDNILFAIAGPICFVFFNSLFVFYPNVGEKIGCPNKKRNLGLVYYPFSVLILVLWVYTDVITLYAATIGVFAMGYGDGFAAIFGSLWGKKRIPLPTGGKTYFGSIVMLIVCVISSFVVLSVMTNFSINDKLLISIIVGVSAAFLEVVTPLGLDNISVPLLTALLVGGLF
ncbi:MAG: diacylglycerol/polyprenol kinase family protein [Pleomorphochaeta sp.]